MGGRAETLAAGGELAAASWKRARPLSHGILAGIAGITDAAIAAATGLLIYAAYVASLEPGRFSLYVTAIGVFCGVLVQSLYAAGLYRFTAIMDPAGTAPRQVSISVLLFLLLLASGFALKISDQFSRLWLFSWLLATVVLSVAARFMLAALVKRWATHGLLRRNILIYGGGRQGERLIQHLQRLNEPWNHVVGVFDDRLGRVGPSVAGLPVLGNLQDLIEWGRANRVDEVLLALPWSAEERLLGVMHGLASLPANVRLSPEFVGMERLNRPVTYQFNVPMLRVMEKPLSGWEALTKAAFDRVLGTFFVIASLPLMGLIAAAIRLESEGPVLFRQQRYGFNHQLINVYKFRTMYSDRLDQGAEQLTRRNDPRVTRVGAFLRRLSLDELPQLFNVLKGEMSVVGPRPHALSAKAGGKLYEDVLDEYAGRYRVKPGITGWAQVHGWRGTTETEQDLIGRVEHDIYYIENWSLLLDLKIIALTAWVVLQGENSY
jgi:Undecaprenyl-phosphate glucose phosphotransferase